MGNETSSWISQNYPILAIVGLIVILLVYAIIRQYRAKKAMTAPKGEQPHQIQPTAKEPPLPSKLKQSAPVPQPAPAKIGFGVGIFNGAPVSISKEAGRANSWVIHPMRYNDYAQSSDEVGKLAVLLATKLRDYENLRSLMAASKEAHDILVKANVDELAPIIQKLQTAINKVEEAEATRGGGAYA